MTQIGLMIEGQDGLNWERWDKLLNAAENLGYFGLFRSDHFTNPNPPDKDSLELWVSLTYAATHTQRIEFGQLVSPITFRHPSMMVRMAAAISDLSNGRYIYGLGAGWQEREHTNFGIPFYDFPTRYAMLEDGLEVTSRLLRSDAPVSYDGEHFSLNEAILLPRPTHVLPILIGGNGPNKTLPMVAKYADEWNAVYATVDLYKERTALLDGYLKENGREPGDVTRSLMNGVYLAKDDANLKTLLDSFTARLGETATVEKVRARGPFIGTPAMIVDQIGEYVQVGVERFMLQWLDQDDIDGLELMARDILPHFHDA